MALLGRFLIRGLADEGSPDPLDLDGARPARAVSRTAPEAADKVRPGRAHSRGGGSAPGLRPGALRRLRVSVRALRQDRDRIGWLRAERQEFDRPLGVDREGVEQDLGGDLGQAPVARVAEPMPVHLLVELRFDSGP